MMVNKNLKTRFLNQGWWILQRCQDLKVLNVVAFFSGAYEEMFLDES
jgi:hypothetical protein